MLNLHSRETTTLVLTPPYPCCMSPINRNILIRNGDETEMEIYFKRKKAPGARGSGICIRIIHSCIN